MREQARESQIARGGQQSAVADSNLAKVVLRGDQPPVYAMQNHAAHHVPVYVDHRGTHHFMMVADPSPSAESGGPPVVGGEVIGMTGGVPTPAPIATGAPPMSPGTPMGAPPIAPGTPMPPGGAIMYAAAPGMMMVPVPPHLQAGYHEMHMVGSPTAPPPAMWPAMRDEAYGAAPLSPHGSPHAHAAAAEYGGFAASPPAIPALEQGSPRGGGGAPFDAAAGLLIDCERVNVGADDRTTIMIRNIPNKYTPDLVLEEINVLFQNEYGARGAARAAPRARAARAAPVPHEHVSLSRRRFLLPPARFRHAGERRLRFHQLLRAELGCAILPSIQRAQVGQHQLAQSLLPRVRTYSRATGDDSAISQL